MLFKKNKKIILASSSSIRQKILAENSVKFETINSIGDENQAKKLISHLSIKDQVIFLAKFKAFDLSIKYPDAIVIGGDQICEFEGKAISKSKDHQDAIKKLLLINNKTHKQNNGVALYRNGQLIAYDYNYAILQMKNLTKDEIENYIKKDTPVGCAGSYKFESFGKDLFTNYEGELNSILGFNIKNILKYVR
jgi:septum formation protein